MWTLSLAPVLIGIVFLAIGFGGTRAIWQRTRGLFRLDIVHALIGLVGVVPTIPILFLLDQDVDSAFSFGKLTGGGVLGTMAGILAVLVLWCGLTACFLYLYVSGVVSEGSGKYDKRPDELDAVAILLQEHRA